MTFTPQSALFRGTKPVSRTGRPRFRREVYIDYSKPNKRWCIVRQCPECRQMAHDGAGYRSAAFYRNGTLVGTPPRSFSYYGWYRDHSRCSECAENSKKFTKVRQCEICGRIRWEGVTGVDYRSDCRKDSPTEWLPSPMLCVSCWNKFRRVRTALRELRDIERAIDRAARERRESLRVRC